jgi:phenylalanyl-tRNA synthetase beta chain
VPEDVHVAAAAVTPSRHQQVTGRVRDLLCAGGFDEAVTFSLLDDDSVAAFSPWSAAEPLRVVHPSRRRERALRKSLIPSLLAARRRNEAHGNAHADLFEIGGVYLPRKAGQLPDEPMMIGLISGRDFAGLKGVCELLADELGTGAGASKVDAELSARAYDDDHACFAPGQGAALSLNDQHWGYLGRISDELADRFKLAAACTVAELRLDVLESAAQLIAQYEPLTTTPSPGRSWPKLSAPPPESISKASSSSTFTAAPRSPPAKSPSTSASPTAPPTAP